MREKLAVCLFYKTFMFIMIFVTFSSLSLLIISNVFATSHNDRFIMIKKANIVNQNNYKHIIGLLQNIGNRTVNHIIITANIFDKNHKSIGNFSKESEVTTLNPKNESPFDILLFDKQIYNLIKMYDLDLKFNLTTFKDEKLRILSNYSNLDSSGFYFINGKLQNMGLSFSNITTVTALTFNKNNKIAGLWKAQSEPYNVPPYSIASFSIPVTDKNQSFQIRYYSLFAQSDKYTLK